MQQKLLIALWIWLGKIFRQPVVMADQLSEQLAAAMQQITFARVAVDQFRQGAYECSESLRVSGLGHGDSIVRCESDPLI
jgi:hypothetical protein